MELLKIKRCIGYCVRQAINPPSHLRSSWERFYERAFPGWIFNAIRVGVLDDTSWAVMASRVGLVVLSDIHWWCREHSLPPPSGLMVGDALGLHWTSVPSNYLKPVLPTIRLSSHQWKRLQECYTGPPEHFQSHVARVASVYKILGPTNKCLSFPPGRVFSGWTEL